jgi:predicted O-methyltransferase YrrM
VGVYRRAPRAREAGSRGTTVVRRGGGLELRVRGTFASYYRPGSALTGSVWDALAAPLLALPRRRRAPSVLLLGLGAGSAARVARALAPAARIVGVEIDPEVVALARRHFELDRLGVEVVQADAAAFLARSRERFDAVLDDVFVGRGRAVRKPAWLLEGGLASAADRVAPGGLLASNALDEAADVARLLAARFPRVVAIDVAGYDNRVLVGGPARLAARALRAAVARSPVLSPTLPALTLRTLRRGAPERGRC